MIQDIENYYKLKADYTKQITKLKKSIINNSELSRQDKRNRFTLLRPKCVICKNPVGSIFTVKDRTLIAVCGATQNTQNGKFEPCSLDIKIKKPSVMLLDEVLEVLRENTETIKEDIISTKVKALFDLIPENEAIKQFEEYKKEYTTINKLFTSSDEKYKSVVDNLDKKTIIKETKQAIYNKINEIKQLVNDKDIDEQFLKDGVELYVNSLIPLIEKLNELQYSKMYMEYNEDEEIYSLVQEEIDIKQLEFIA